MIATQPPSIFFLSDYGDDDEFVGVVHAVLTRHAPGVTVVDLTHGIPPFDVRAGEQALWRAAPYLGTGAVLAVVDPGVGTGRRCVALQVETSTGPRWWVGPDNGLLMAGAERVGRLVRAVALTVADKTARGAASEAAANPSTTFDGRDVMAPAAAALAIGQTLPMGTSVESPNTIPVDSLTRLPTLLRERSVNAGREGLRVGVSWIDHFGNVQLAATPPDLPGPEVKTIHVREHGDVQIARRIFAFAELGPEELGILVDANGRLALVRNRGSAAQSLVITTDDLLELSWKAEQRPVSEQE